MGRKLLLSALLVLVFSGTAAGKDIIPTSGGDLEITFVGHGTLIFRFQEKVIHVDPVGRYADYSGLPRAHMILVTHDHGDHLDPKVIRSLSNEDTDLILSRACAEKMGAGTVMENGDVRTVQGMKLEAVPAYNLVHMRSQGVPFHSRGRGNGYVITFGEKRVYVAGDSENIPEMKALKDIDIAFLPMNLPYTMTPEMAADGAKAFRPRILYPYHYGETDPSKLVKLLKEVTEIEVRIREMR